MMMVVFIMEANGVVREIFMELWTSKWLHGKELLGNYSTKMFSSNKHNKSYKRFIIYAIL
jgi:hypothetical protein